VFGVYVHVPFCASRCDYCAFATWTDRSHLMADYAAACVAEVRAATGVPEATSVFFGGGTPSLLPAELLVSILDAVPRTADAEVTVECNPDTVSPPLFDAYGAAGVNRVSFGVQSMVPHVLAGLGRTHDVEHVRTAVADAAAAGFDAYNVDLIYGGAGESMADWDATLAAVLALDPSPAHVSAYALTVEPGTPLAADPSRHPDDDDQADKYLRADDVLAAAGLHNYEISNWAGPGHECRHNLLYWSQGDYRGIGCAAHSHERGWRWWNARTPERYISLVNDGRSPVAAGETLDDTTRALEALQLSLRTRRGVPAARLDDVDDLAGLIEPAGEDGVVLTRRGRLLANEVAHHLSP
jgi:oxygen-independent coproporphyrinogen-3 oxidase